MPIYEFRCLDCNKYFEALVLKSDEEISCPECKGTNIERLMSVCSFKSGESFVSSSSSSCFS